MSQAEQQEQRQKDFLEWGPNPWSKAYGAIAENRDGDCPGRECVDLALISILCSTRQVITNHRSLVTHLVHSLIKHHSDALSEFISPGQRMMFQSGAEATGDKKEFYLPPGKYRYIANMTPAINTTLTNAASSLLEERLEVYGRTLQLDNIAPGRTLDDLRKSLFEDLPREEILKRLTELSHAVISMSNGVVYFEGIYLEDQPIDRDYLLRVYVESVAQTLTQALLQTPVVREIRQFFQQHKNGKIPAPQPSPYSIDEKNMMKSYNPLNPYDTGTKPFTPVNPYDTGTKPFTPINPYDTGTKILRRGGRRTPKKAPKFCVPSTSTSTSASTSALPLTKQTDPNVPSDNTTLGIPSRWLWIAAGLLILLFLYRMYQRRRERRLVSIE